MDSPESSPQLECISASSWEGKPIVPQDWLVQGMIPMHTTTALAGDGGIGKSLLAMQLQTCCGAGKRFLNKDTMACVSLGLFCEDQENQLHERQSRIIQHYSVSYSDISDVHYLPRVGDENSLITISNFNKKVEPSAFFKQFRQLALDVKAKLIVIDTAADTFGGNEIHRSEVRSYVQLLNGLANDIQGAVLLIVHPSLHGLSTGTGTSGSTAWNNSVRSRWYLEKPEVKDGDIADSNARILTQKKSNYSSIDNTGMELIWQDGAFALTADENEMAKKSRLKYIKDTLLIVMKDLAENGLFLSHSENSTNYTPKKAFPYFKVKCTFNEVKSCYEQCFMTNEIILVDRKIDGKTRQCSGVNPHPKGLSLIRPID